jgi:hypothetical protein
MTTQYEVYNTNDDNSVSFWGAHWQAQTFKATSGHTVTSVKIKVGRNGSPGTVTVGIRNTSGAHPGSTEYTSGTINGNSFTTIPTYTWYEISVTEYTLTSGTVYAIVVRAPSGSSSNWGDWRMDHTSPTYGDGNREESADSGSSWTSYTVDDLMFEVWGNPGIVIPTVTTQAATSIGLD